MRVVAVALVLVGLGLTAAALSARRVPAPRHPSAEVGLVPHEPVRRQRARRAQPRSVDSAQRRRPARAVRSGTLDTSFGARGRLLTDIPTVEYVGDAVAVQPDRKIVLAGVARVKRDQRFVIARYTRAGRVDRAFGARGRVSIDWPGPEIESLDVLLQPDGRIVVVGMVLTGSGDNDDAIAAVRLLDDGAPDPSFGDGGRVLVRGQAFGSDFEECDLGAGRAMLDAQGRLVVSATPACVGEGGAFPMQVGVARLTTDGVLDRTFAEGGTWTAAMACSGGAVAIQRDGKILVAGPSPAVGSCPDDEQISVDRLNADRTEDVSFGSGGQTQLRLPAPGFANMYAADVAVGPNGAITLGGAAGSHPAIARLTPSGQRDPTFTPPRLQIGRRSDEWIGALALTSLGEVVAVGTSTAGRGRLGSRGFVARLTTTGARDPAFAGGGLRRLRFGGTRDEAWDVAVAADGRIIVAGSSRRPRGGQVLALARLTG